MAVRAKPGALTSTVERACLSLQQRFVRDIR
jgi:hypothetical protein